MNEPTQKTSIPTQPYAHRNHFEVEPVAFALALIAVVASISSWNPSPPAERLAPVEAAHTVAQAPSR